MTTPSPAARAMPLHDLHPEPDDLYSEVVSGLRSNPKTLPCKYFYDATGSRLFDRICDLEEYYPTRTEIRILKENAKDIAQAVGQKTVVIELGSGSSTKTHVLLNALVKPTGYLPIDISREHLTEAADRIAERFPELPVWPICADFNQPIELPEHGLDAFPPLIFFPGSTIGNFGREGRGKLLDRMADLCRSKGSNGSKRLREESNGRLLIGIDLIKDIDRLENAYDDSQGVTAAFNLNLLHRINRELDSDFDLSSFKHQARFNVDESRVEMHLESEHAQTVRIDEEEFHLKSGESICTEHSYKFRIDDFESLAAESGWILEKFWTDPEDLFAILLFRID